MGLAHISYAAVIPGTACDTDINDVHEARAWMEGKRELEAAQLIILKPDSVLEYSCFNQQLNNLGSSGPWSNNNGHGNMNSGLNWVRNANNTFLNNNFGDPGGGTPGAPGYNCGAMSAIWDLWDHIKCMTFDDYADFRTFSELASTDYRTLPNSCNEANRANKWNTAIGAANPAPNLPPTSGGIARADTFLNQLDPTACGSISPIETGLIVITSAPYPDAVCSAPGCYYDGSGGCN